MTESEKTIVKALAKVWNLYLKLPIEHQSERVEFMQAIHAAQNIVLARSGRREMKEAAHDR